MTLTKDDLQAIESLLDRKLDEKFAAFRSAFKSELIVAVGEMIEQQILPQFEKLDTTVERHERVFTGMKRVLVTAGAPEHR